MAIEFGTDGWRAVISEDFTFENVRKVAQAIADEARLRHQTEGLDSVLTMVVGFDTRFLSDRYAITVSEVLAANAIHLWLAQGDAPTPMVSFAIVAKGADGGVMITASHNPPRYNGIKLKAGNGGSASPEEAKAVEARIKVNDAAGMQPQRVELQEGLAKGLIQRFTKSF